MKIGIIRKSLKDYGFNIGYKVVFSFENYSNNDDNKIRTEENSSIRQFAERLINNG